MNVEVTFSQQQIYFRALLATDTGTDSSWLNDGKIGNED